jgi:hypothetical protein
MRAISARRAVLGLLAVLSLSATAAPARADTVTRWNEVAAAALQSPGSAVPPGAGQGATSTAHLAMVHAAVHDAVNAIDRGHEPYVSSPAAKPWYSQEAAVAAAARHVLLDGGLNGAAGFAPARIALIETAYTDTLAGIPPGPAREGGIATGVAAATALLDARSGDGRFGPFRFTESTAVGFWRLVPPATVTDTGAWLKDVTPFVLPSSSLFRGRSPRPLWTRAYARDFDEVKAYGSVASSVRTPEQKAAAEYWGLTNATATMASIFRSVADNGGGTLADHARLLARIYTNAADALIVTWGEKARHSFWRPYWAIREAASDGNDRTEADPGWTALISNPPYPEHPSGLSTFAGAAVETMQDFYDTDCAEFSGTTPGGVTRTFSSFSQVVDDVVDARVWSGIHFRFADDEGARIGRKVARWGNRHAFE